MAELICNGELQMAVEETASLQQSKTKSGPTFSGRATTARDCGNFVREPYVGPPKQPQNLSGQPVVRQPQNVPQGFLGAPEPFRTSSELFRAASELSLYLREPQNLPEAMPTP